MHLNKSHELEQWLGFKQLRGDRGAQVVGRRPWGLTEIFYYYKDLMMYLNDRSSGLYHTIQNKKDFLFITDNITVTFWVYKI